MTGYAANQCEHGSLARSCALCEFQCEIASLDAAVGKHMAQAEENRRIADLRENERDEARARVAQMEAALREHFAAFDGYGFNCGNDQSYMTQMVDDLRAALAPAFEASATETRSK